MTISTRSVATLPATARARRWAHYLRVMFPPVALVPMGAAQFFSVYLALQALAGLAPLRFGWPSREERSTGFAWIGIRSKRHGVRL